MVEILRNFEQMVGRFPPTVLLAPGLALVVLGLIVWLGGMCLRRLVLALAGAAVVGTAAFVAGVQNAAVVGVLMGGGALLGAVLPRLSTAILLATLGMVAAFIIRAPTPPGEGPRILSSQPDPAQGQERFTTPESLDIVRAHALDLTDYAKAAARHLGLVDLAVIAGGGLVLLVLGLLLARLAGALVCSTLGSLLIFAGLIVLLMFKGSAPVALVQKQGALYGLVLLGMAAFGTLEQLVLCPSPRRPKATTGSGKSHCRRDRSERKWRDR